MKQRSETKKRSKKVGIEGLSTLEADILNIVWEQKTTIVRRVHEVMLEEGYIPYTTIMAAMNNMALKGLLKQNKGDKTYVYSAAISREDMAKALLDTIINKILGGVATPLILHLIKGNEEDVRKLLGQGNSGK
ncbi:MAG: BlaI/MecI/CopY family transcriptional regulator [Candidatus Aquicultor sp.]